MTEGRGGRLAQGWAKGIQEPAGKVNTFFLLIESHQASFKNRLPLWKRLLLSLWGPPAVASGLSPSESETHKASNSGLLPRGDKIAPPPPLQATLPLSMPTLHPFESSKLNQCPQIRALPRHHMYLSGPAFS